MKQLQLALEPRLGLDTILKLMRGLCSDSQSSSLELSVAIVHFLTSVAASAAARSATWWQTGP